ncbi:MAG TPA: adenylate/guanylate cyclase domain-containing protein, partial [Stellaceae bacterium]|nr:adenylate/guanylate cyclase domain-containing protein [Stellaceae bacterium]
HVVSTRVADSWFNADYGYYSSILTLYAVEAPGRGVLQLVVLVVAWVHAMIGIRYSLMLRPWYPRWQPILFALALLLPTLAILGAFEGVLQTQALAHDPGFLARMAQEHPKARPASDAATIDAIGGLLRAGFVGALAAALLARVARRQWQRWRGIVRLTYPSGRVVEIVPGLSVLEASRFAGIPHASVCGGRGRCSTCRIRIAGDLSRMPVAAADERKVLDRVGAAPDVRLACQLRPLGDLAVTPLLPASAQAADGFWRPDYLQGMEKEIIILFADIRAFTQLSEQKLPYDVVFLLNRYFAEMGNAVEQAGGRIDKFIGDGVMALFGLDSGPARGAREALVAARAMAERLAELNRVLAQDLPEPLRIGIGIHVGPAIVGEMGYGKAVSVTAVGDSVNTASRLEVLTKEFGAQLVVSEAVVERAQVGLDGIPRREIEIRGRVERLRILALISALDLPAPVAS